MINSASASEEKTYIVIQTAHTMLAPDTEIVLENNIDSFRSDLIDYFQKYPSYSEYNIQFHGNFLPLVPIVHTEILKLKRISTLNVTYSQNQSTPLPEEDYEILSNHLHANHVRMMEEKALKDRNYKIAFEKGMASREANAELIKQATPYIEQELRKRADALKKAALELNPPKQELSNNALYAIIAGIIGCGFYFGFLPTILATMALGIGAVAKRLFYHASAHNYETVDSIAKVISPSEKAALKAGIKAVTWKGYFISYTNLSSYKHPVAFAGAYVQAATENRNIVDAIKKLKI